jgi:LytTr DNA-binding domain
MSDAADLWFKRYLPVRRWFEIGFWVAVLILQATLNTAVLAWDFARVGQPVPLWQPAVLEATSNFVVLLLIPGIIAFERLFPLRWDTFARNLPWHLVGTVLFCVAHVALMVALREAAFALAGSDYRFVGWRAALLYEYLKDARSYALILCAILGYRLLMWRLQGQVRELDAPEPPSVEAAQEPSALPPQTAPASPRHERFLVRKLRKEFLINAADIESVQAQGNYVALHLRGHDYLLRSTLAEFEQKLDPALFKRVHRSHIVNLNHIAEIEPQESGDARIKLRGGEYIPCSRRYRSALEF